MDSRPKIDSQTPKDRTRSVSSIVGTLRSIEASILNHEKLPMEEALGIELPSNGGLKIEIGSFTIDREFNQEVFVELWLSMIREAQGYLPRPTHQANKPLFFTYADPASVRMYVTPAMGFKILESYEAVEYEGRQWRLIGISAEDLVTLPQRIANGRAQWKEDQVASFSALVNAAQSLHSTQPFRASHIAVSYEIGPKAQNPTSVKITENRAEQRLKIWIARNGSTAGSIELPTSILPLMEGRKYELEDSGIVTQLVYSGGQLRGVAFRQNKVQAPYSGPSTFRIETDPEFLHFRRIRYKAYWRDEQGYPLLHSDVDLSL